MMRSRIFAAAWLLLAAPVDVRGDEPDQPQDPRESAVRQVIDGYFAAWSSQDLDRYGRLFMPKAAIQLIDPAGELITVRLAPFLESQREAHRRAKNRLTESAERVDVRFEAELARVVVYWKLLDGDRVEYGYDHFTLIKSGDQWRIANLLFYAVKPKAKP